MDKQWMQWCALALVLAAGCGDEAGAMPWSEPDPNDGVAGTAGEALAGSGGSAGDIDAPTAGVGGLGGIGGEGGSITVPTCNPDAPDAADPPGQDAGATDDPMLADGDAGVDPAPDAGVIDPMPDGGMTSAPRAPIVGEVVISEVMMDPTALTDSLGEWIELHNPTTSELTLDGCVISDDRSDDFALVTLSLPAGGYLVLGRSAQAAPHIDYVYSGMTLANTNDEIVITCNGIAIDRVAYAAGYPRPAGHPMQLASTMLSASANDQPVAWCAAENEGTPGAANTVCAGE